MILCVPHFFKLNAVSLPRCRSGADHEDSLTGRKCEKVEQKKKRFIHNAKNGGFSLLLFLYFKCLFSSVQFKLPCHMNRPPDFSGFVLACFVLIAILSCARAVETPVNLFASCTEEEEKQKTPPNPHQNKSFLPIR